MISFINVNKPLRFGIFFSISMLMSIMLFSVPSNAFAEVSVESFAIEETTIMEVTNDSNQEVKTLRIWLGSDFSFKSFKTENKWTGEKTPQGVIVFTSSESINPGESIKFGIKTDKVIPGINWKVLDNSGNQIDTGLVIPGEIPNYLQGSQSTDNKNSEDSGMSMTEKS